MLTTFVPSGGNVGRCERVGVDVLAEEVEEAFTGSETDDVELPTDTVRESSRKLVITVVISCCPDTDADHLAWVDCFSVQDDGGLVCDGDGRPAEICGNLESQYKLQDKKLAV